MLSDAKKRAKAKGLPFELTLEDIMIPARCPWLGIPLIAGPGTKQDGSPSLDKIVPEFGYINGNVIVISELANRIKSNGTPEQIAAVARGLRSVYPQWLLID